ncbi:hypothetical protein PHYSODRAFT_284499 [Phytophthora sojae]|uniref:RxLR effector protein n=2 Tax=Phytophthora sojae TaxID=67593 RepID=G4YHU7_PHYSP|nr:hypothetical protein PHYSODRAFT_284499 [Phytophthora sojae]AEK81303.1 Avh421 [Phytophthora sojae]AEK81304.1 Avh421 [Phytophthora sojae]AEK81305.1 Avh421 [Phytophthora sojae]EGZ29674.1 hypothetical protein PHYSODRAFT_284499 [Phytophthora sojae]|eukprot:XP_009516949.1 hypothetical protein PHYSODRAFT_284499 [Phytophthora sojae]
MRVYSVFLLAAFAFLAGSRALPAAAVGDAAEASTFTFTERPHGRSLTSEKNGGDYKRTLRKHEKSTVTEGDDNSEERSMWDTLVKKAQLQYWFQKGKKPAWVRAKLGIPSSGANLESHKYTNSCRPTPRTTMVTSTSDSLATKTITLDATRATVNCMNRR